MKHKVRHVHFVGIGGMTASRERVPAAPFGAVGGDRPRAGSAAAVRHESEARR